MIYDDTYMNMSKYTCIASDYLQKWYIYFMTKDDKEKTHFEKVYWNNVTNSSNPIFPSRLVSNELTMASISTLL